MISICLNVLYFIIVQKFFRMDRIKYHTHILLLIAKIYIKKMKTRKDK